MSVRTVLTSDRVLVNGQITEASILLEGETIADVRRTRNSFHATDGQVIDVGHQIIAPGLVDLHVHGAGGHSFEEVDRVVEQARSPGGIGPAHDDPVTQILRHLASQGVTSVLASLASDEIRAMAARTRALQGRHADPGVHETELLGVHLEGPFLAESQRGAHDPGNLRSPSTADASELVSLAPAMVTLAPELPGALGAIRAFADAGTVVAAGHSEASGHDLAAAVGAGLKHITHLWSGQSSMSRSGPWRMPGLLEESLASTGLTAEIIADGKHLPPALLEIARRCLGDRLIIVSDATAGAGMPEGFRYSLASVECEVRDGVGMLLDGGSFGGSTTTLLGMLTHLHRELGWPLAEVIDMCSARPAQVAGIAHRKGAIAPGMDADVAILTEDLKPSMVFTRGVQAPCSRG